jgi:hypothetical protein
MEDGSLRDLVDKLIDVLEHRPREPPVRRGETNDGPLNLLAKWCLKSPAEKSAEQVLEVGRVYSGREERPHHSVDNLPLLRHEVASDSFLAAEESGPSSVTGEAPGPLQRCLELIEFILGNFLFFAIRLRF